MSKNERIRTVREQLNLSQEEFGKQIGIGRSALSQIETGRTQPSEQTVILVCDKFNVSDKWLRDGTGEMFTPQDPEQEIATFLGKIVKDDDDSLRKRLISALAKLDESDWAALAEMVRKMKKDPEP